MGFVGNYAPCGLAPQIDDMPVIPKKYRPHKACNNIFRYSTVKRPRLPFFVTACDHSSGDVRSGAMPLSLQKAIAIQLQIIYNDFSRIA